MSRQFDGTTARKLEINSAVLTGTPLTLAAWFRSNSITAAQSILTISNGGTTANYFRISAHGSVGGDPLRAQTAGGSYHSADSTSGYSANVWHHGCGVFTSSASVKVYLDGGNSATDNPGVTPTGLDTTTIGSEDNGGVYNQPFDGEIANAVIYNVALTDAEVLSLSLGCSPLLVRPGNIAAYWHLIGNDSPEPDFVGGFDMAVTAAVKAEQPRIIMPRGAYFPGIVPVTASFAYRKNPLNFHLMR